MKKDVDIVALHETDEQVLDVFIILV